MRIPLTSYTPPDIHALHERLIESRCLPVGWTCSAASATSLALCKLSFLQSMGSADVVYMVTISSDFSWRVRIGQKYVPFHETESGLLHNAPHSLNSLKGVVEVLTLLDGSKFCVGNPEEKFFKLIEKRNGKFMDQSGNLHQHR